MWTSGVVSSHFRLGWLAAMFILLRSDHLTTLPPYHFTNLHLDEWIHHQSCKYIPVSVVTYVLALKQEMKLLSKPTFVKYKSNWRRAGITWHCFFFSLVLVLVVLTLRCLLDTQVMFGASQSSWEKLLSSVISKSPAVSVFFIVNLLTVWQAHLFKGE